MNARERAHWLDVLNRCAYVANALNPKDPIGVEVAHRELWAALNTISEEWPLDDTAPQPREREALAWERLREKGGSLDRRSGLWWYTEGVGEDGWCASAPDPVDAILSESEVGDGR